MFFSNGESQMRKSVAFLGLVALVVGGVFVVSPKTTTVANEAAIGIDTAALTKMATGLAEQQFPAH